jgi:hypothetical protein
VLHRARDRQTPRRKLRGVCLNFRRGKTMQPGTSFAIRAFDSGRHQEATMRFSMNSYLLGVGTVVGALAFGFGGGILLTKTAIKDTPAGPSRIERAARPEPASPPQVQMTEAKAIPVPRAEPAPAVEPGPPVQAAAEPKPAPDIKPAARPEPKAAEPVRQMEAPRQSDRPAEQPVTQADAPKQIEQKEVGQEMTAREQRRAEREQRRAERRMERERYTAERRARTVEYGRTRQRPVEIQEQPARPELAYEREEPKPPALFEGLFGRPAEAAPAQRE